MALQASASIKLRLSALLAADSVALEMLELCLRERGWVLLELDPPLNAQVDSLLAKAQQLFTSSQFSPMQNQHHLNFGFLVNESRKTMALRTLTGRFCSALPLPSSIKAHIAQLCAQLDDVMYSLVAATCTAVFARSLQELSSSVQIPLLNHADPQNRCGMLDVVSYQYCGDYSAVSEHADPGLFALSLKSSSPGLQLFDHSTEMWIPIEPDQTVLWCGSSAVEASNSVIKAAFHRVVLPAAATSEPRLTAWYEICALDQIPSSMLRDRSFPVDQKAAVASESLDVVVTVKTLTGKEIPIRIPASATVLDLKEKIQDKEGIPPSKMRLVVRVKPTAPDANGQIRQLEDDKLLFDYGIDDESVVYSVLSLRTS